MNITRIYYYHNLNLTFKSAQTIQVVKDYYYLSKLSIEVNIYGTFENEDDYKVIKKFLKDSKVNLIAKKQSFWNRVYLKLLIIRSLIFDHASKIIVTRHYKKLSLAIKLKQVGFNFRIIHEMHEESFPYFFKSISKRKIKLLLLNNRINNLIFTNYSQVDLFNDEFGSLPKNYAILPNGVELNKFYKVNMKSNFVLTYVGQFNKWKNLGIMFHALSKLDKKYSLRIAGGKGNLQSKILIDSLIKKYKIDPSRVDYLGYVDNKDVPKLVLHDSNVLLLPLGDNIQSIYLTSPMKLFEYMSTKIPVLAIDYPSVSSIASGAIFLSKNNADDFVLKIKEICKKTKSEFDFREMNRIAKNYSYSNRSKKYLEVINGNL
jgi:glycosyltransferase involved in cell wall biosynthesis